MIILDFSKAFDTVPHNRLLNKLDRYGIRNKTHTWISNFLKYRKQRVVIGGEHSTWTQVMSGVPQGTVLGPLLFLTYINDLPNNIHSSICLFADDCVLYREIKNEIDSQELQKVLNSLMKWEYDWQMNFNPKTGLDIGYVPAGPDAFLRWSGQFGPQQLIFYWPAGPVDLFFYFLFFYYYFFLFFLFFYFFRITIHI